jgi:hypothetical protein
MVGSDSAMQAETEIHDQLLWIAVDMMRRRRRRR